MTIEALDDLARRHGIGLHHTASDHTELYISDETKRAILNSLGVACATDAEITASLKLASDMEPPVMRAAEGRRCALPGWLAERKAWGISLQLYELRSARNWGIGDFADLAAVAKTAAEAGADFVGVNPLHALFLSDPAWCSPFSPSNRLFLNPLYIAVDQVLGFATDLADPTAIAALRATDAVDYAGVTALKIGALKRLWATWRAKVPDTGAYSGKDYEAFCARGGDPLRGHALFETLSARMVAEGYTPGWPEWPEQYRDVNSPEVQSFALLQADTVEFYTWLQWVADVQLEQAAAAAREAGMRIGLYLDFAVGEAPDGSATWSTPDSVLQGMTIGAPPDFFTTDGQEWGLAPPSPTTMRRTDFAQYRQTMDALTRHAGALRVDHAMALWQLFLVPPSGRPADGAYLRYPIEDMLRTLTDVSQTNGTVIIGEDLGYVPAGFQDVMKESNMLSYRILYFEKDDGGFFAPKDYPVVAMACLSTHDLPTLRGWWRGDDVDLRLEHGLIDAEAATEQRFGRRTERRKLIDGMLWFGVLAESDRAAAFAAADDAGSEIPEALMVATHRMVGRTASVLATVRLADLTFEERPTNLPGTVDTYPNWRLKNGVPIEDLAAQPLFQSICAVMAEERPKS